MGRLSTPEPAFCAVCRRRAGPLGYAKKGHGFFWACRDEDCREQLRKVYQMSQPDFDPIELDALDHGGERGGEFLESIGKTDLTELTGDEWREFLERVVDGFGCHLRERLCSPHIPE